MTLAAVAYLAFVAAITLGLWWAYRRPPAVTLTRMVTARAFQDARIPLTVTVTLRSALPLRFVIEDPSPRSVVPDTQPFLGGELLGRRDLTVHTTLTLNRRGVYDWPGATLRWADPLGLYWRRTPLTAPQRLEVLPATHGVLLPDLLRPLLSEGGWNRTRGLDDPISLRSAREYVPGDPPGRVHWRLTARTGQLTVREPERTAASSVTVYVDQRGTDVYVDSAARLAASLIREASTLNLPVAVATNGSATPTGRDEAALHAALRRLAEVNPAAAAPVIPPVRPGGNLIILSANPGPALIEQAMRARATASRVAIVALPEGFYLEPGERPRRQWVAAPDSVRELERQAGVLAGAGIVVFVLRGNQSVLKLGA